MRLLIDENVRNEVIEFLKDSGHDILVVHPGSGDRLIAQTAKETKRILLTNDQDFTDILTYPPKEYSGIIRIKIHPPNPAVITNALKDLFNKLSPEQIDGKLVILEHNAFRIR